jgi:hypothetical protein
MIGVGAAVKQLGYVLINTCKSLKLCHHALAVYGSGRAKPWGGKACKHLVEFVSKYVWASVY